MIPCIKLHVVVIRDVFFFFNEGEGLLLQETNPLQHHDKKKRHYQKIKQ